LKRLYISDLDGTLLDSSGIVTAGTADTLNRLISEGMYFTFATARSPYSIVHITAPLKISVPCILMNGVSIYDRDRREFVKNEFIPVSASHEALRAFEENDVRCFMYKICDGVLTCCYSEMTTAVMRSFAEVRKNRYNKPFVQYDRLIDHADSEVVYLTTTGGHDRLYPVKQAAEGIEGLDCAFYKDTYEDKWYLELFSHKASKANGVKYLRDRYGFDEVVAFGDNLNDLPMFAQADIKVAVGNARDEVKAAADHIIGTCDEDGVAQWLKSVHLSE